MVFSSRDTSLAPNCNESLNFPSYIGYLGKNDNNNNQMMEVMRHFSFGGRDVMIIRDHRSLSDNGHYFEGTRRKKVRRSISQTIDPEDLLLLLLIQLMSKEEHGRHTLRVAGSCKLSSS